MKWFEEYIKMFFKGQRDEAYKLKHINIPNKLFKYQPPDYKRLSNILDDKIWFSTPKTLNDPFDSQGVCWNAEELLDYFKVKLPKQKLSNVDSIVQGGLDSLNEHIIISCFSEELFNMPMWAHYAQNHQGFCVEYNFSELVYTDDFSKYLYPVGYESFRYDITNLYKIVINDPLDPRIYLLFFLMHIKHISWGYEKEWRIIRLSDDGQSGLVDCPVKPTAIYLGMNCQDVFIKHLLNNINIPVYKFKSKNTKFFELEALSLQC